MKHSLNIILIIILALILTACGGTSDTSTGGQENITGDTNNGQSSRPTPTPIVLETPTSKPAPATPTPKATATPKPAEPTPEPVEEPTAETTDATDTETTDSETTDSETSEEPTPEPLIEEDTGQVIAAEMILIPAGPFTMGSDNSDAEDSPAHIVDLPAFEIDKFEVSNDDFSLFVTDTGYQTVAEVSDGRSWKDYAKDKGNHPVVKVTWDDAVAFCEWAGKRLPTEEEWEKAARGEDGRIYPWGNEFDASLANVKDTAIRNTTASGSFPGGASPYGVEDIAGNVWEWTATWYKAYPGNDVENSYFGERFRVTRGGAWFEEAPQVTTFNRNAADPAITANDDVGFRCAKDVQ